MRQTHCNTKEEFIEKGRDDHAYEPFIILLPNAIIHPRTVMVEPVHAPIA